MQKPTAPSRRTPVRLVMSLLVLVLGGFSAARAQTNFSQIIVFGDSLSDTGNDADVSDAKYHVRVPGSTVNYTDGRFTSGKDTDPASSLHGGIWHEQLAKLFLNLPAATASLDGGLDYAYGGATTDNGTSVLNFTTGIGITVNNIGQQVSDYLAANKTDASALYIVWGGANDIFVSDTSAAALLATGKAAAKREVALITRLAQAGAVTFLVPNLPPIGNTPRYNGSMGDIAAYNAACQAFSAKLDTKLAAAKTALAAQGLNVTIYRLDVYGLFERLLANQQGYNFYNITQSAQGESVKADNYLFWDDVHPTASGHYQLAVEAYTVLTGRPLVQVAPDFTADGFYVTRSGTDDTAKLVVPYTVSGTAVGGTDYTTLKGNKVIHPDTSFNKVKVSEIEGDAKGKTVILTIADGGNAFGVGTVTTAQVQFGNPIQATNAINERPATPRAAPTHLPLMLPGSGR